MTEDSRRRHEHLLSVVSVLPTDYKGFGGQVERGADLDIDYPDCSGGCKWSRPLWDAVRKGVDEDWLVCARSDGPRRGLLTFEHQAGFGCFESEDE